MDLVPRTTDEYIMWYVVRNAPVRALLYVISYVNLNFIILMFIIYKYDGLLNIINLLLTEYGIELFQLINKVRRDRTTEKSLYRTSAF